MLKQLLIATALTASAASAFAVGHYDIDRTVALNDGATLYVFKDGKMGMEDRYGRPMYMESGHAMQTADGQKIIMNGNETARVEQYLFSQGRLTNG
jgi:hypothetical protein